ncbi:MAG: hypothetical protein JW746_09210 [Candidatus Krumholzibacteriota bacterium]|nr:hypothetical protein [Candidatus Krumholzibacteriota bacterium]
MKKILSVNARDILSVLTLASILYFAGCGKDVESENRKDLESGRIDSVTLKLLPEKIRVDDFSIRVPAGFRVTGRGKEYAEKRGDISIELKGDNSSSVLIYGKSSVTGLEIREFIALIDEIDRGAYNMAISVRSYKKIRFSDIPALLVEGSWSNEGDESSPLRVVGFECGRYFYIIQSVIRSESGEWDPLPWSITNTFQCGAD